MTIRVGIYDAPQVAVRAAPTVLQRAPSTAGMQQLGQGISAVAQAIDEEAKRLDRVRVDEFQNNLIPFVGMQAQKARELKGADALKPDKDGKSPMSPRLEEFDKYVEDSLKGLGNDRQRREAARVAEAHKAKFSAELKIHQANEQKNYEKSVSLDKLKVNTDLVSQTSADPDAVKASMATIATAVQELNPGMKVDATVKENQSKAALSAVQDAIKGRQMVKGRLDHLMEYMTPEDKATAMKLSETSDASTVALRLGQAYFDPKMSQADVVRLADTEAKDNPTLHKAILQEFRDRKAAAEDDQKAQDSSWFAEVSEKLILKKAGANSLRQDTDANKSLSKEGRARVFKLLDDWAEKGKHEAEESKFPSLIALITSPTFHEMSKEEMLTALPKYGSLGPQLFRAWQDATADGGALKIPANVVKLVAAELNLDPKDEEQAAALGQAVLQTSSYFSQQAKGKGKFATKPPTQEEMAKELRFRATPVVVETHWYGDKKRPMATLSAPEVQRAAEVLGVATKKIAIEYWRRRGITNPSAGDMLRAAYNLDALQKQDPKSYKLIHDTVFPPGADPYVPDDWKEPR